jgi:hypothetical protein
VTVVIVRVASYAWKRYRSIITHGIETVYCFCVDSRKDGQSERCFTSCARCMLHKLCTMRAAQAVHDACCTSCTTRAAHAAQAKQAAHSFSVCCQNRMDTLFFLQEKLDYNPVNDARARSGPGGWSGRVLLFLWDDCELVWFLYCALSRGCGGCGGSSVSWLLQNLAWWWPATRAKRR